MKYVWLVGELARNNARDAMRFFAGDLATPNIKAWRFVFDEGNYWLLTAVQQAIASLGDGYNWIAEGDLPADEAGELALQAINSLEPTMDLIGLIFPFAGDDTHVPEGALLCDGSSYLRTNFPDLFSVIGTTYGATDGTHFSVPDLRGRTLLGVGTGSGLSTYALGAQGGEEAHVLTVSELAAHTHIDTGHTHIESAAAPTAILIGVGAPAPSAVPVASVTGSGSANLANSGGNSAHENRQPYTAVNYIISAVH